MQRVRAYFLRQKTRVFARALPEAASAPAPAEEAARQRPENGAWPRAVAHPGPVHGPFWPVLLATAETLLRQILPPGQGVTRIGFWPWIPDSLIGHRLYVVNHAFPMTRLAALFPDLRVQGEQHEGADHATVFYPRAMDRDAVAHDALCRLHHLLEARQYTGYAPWHLEAVQKEHPAWTREECRAVSAYQHFKEAFRVEPCADGLQAWVAMWRALDGAPRRLQCGMQAEVPPAP